jgi:RNA polymerase sigma factor (sigma-70 family)
MTTGTLATDLRTLFEAGGPAARTDAELLARFLARRDAAGEHAFAALVGRHGRMVRGVCLGILRDPHDADDAFQAAFLVLARRAGSLRVGETLGPWLHAVALRVALAARSEQARRGRREAARLESDPPRTAAEPPDDPRELAALVHEELGRLPSRYRDPLVLCDLEGRTYEQAAGALGWPVGTVKSRLSRGRARLRDRLTRRGVAPAVALVALARVAEAAAPPTAGLVTTATLAACGGPTTAAVAGLAAAVLKSLAARASILPLTLAALSVLGAGLYAATPQNPAPRREPPADPTPAAAAGAKSDPVRDRLRVALRESIPGIEAMPSPWERGLALAAAGRAQAEAGDPEGARATLALAAKAAEAEDSPYMRLVVLARVAPALALAGDDEGARKVVARMTAIADDLPEAERPRYLGETAAAQAKSGDRAGAEATLKRAFDDLAALDDNPRLNALIRVVQSAASAGVFDLPLDAIDALPAEQSNWKDPLLRDFCTFAVAEQPHAEGLGPALDRARQIAETITYVVPRGNALYGIAESQAKAGEPAMARGTAMLIYRAKDENFDNIDSLPLALAPIAVAQAKAGDLEGARATADEAAKIALGLESYGATIRGERLRRVAEAQAEIGDPDAALQTAEAIRDNNYELGLALAAVGAAQAKAGQADAARATFARARDLIGAIGERKDLLGDMPDSNRDHLAAALAAAEALAGFTDDARATAELRGDHGHNLAQVAESLARSGRVSDALDVARAIDADGAKAIAMEAIAAAQADAGDLAPALDWAVSLPPGPVRAAALQALARRLEARP